MDSSRLSLLKHAQNWANTSNFIIFNPRLVRVNQHKMRLNGNQPEDSTIGTNPNMYRLANDKYSQISLFSNRARQNGFHTR